MLTGVREILANIATFMNRKNLNYRTYFWKKNEYFSQSVLKLHFFSLDLPLSSLYTQTENSETQMAISRTGVRKTNAWDVLRY